MKTKMTHAMRLDKRRILKELVAATGYHEKSAICVLNNSSEVKPPRMRHQPSIYDEAARGVLIVLWEATHRMCGKRLKALLPLLLPALERNGHLRLDEGIGHKLLSVSGHDRLLAPYAEGHEPHEKADSDAGSAAAHQNAHLTRLRRAAERSTAAAALIVWS